MPLTSVSSQAAKIQAAVRGAAVRRAGKTDEPLTDLSLKSLKAVIADNHARIADVFKAWDDDKNGKVSKKEFRNAIQALGYEATVAQINAVFDQLDKDGSGSIDYRELKVAVSGTAKKTTNGQKGSIVRRDLSAKELLQTKRDLQTEVEAHEEAIVEKGEALAQLASTQEELHAKDESLAAKQREADDAHADVTELRASCTRLENELSRESGRRELAETQSAERGEALRDAAREAEALRAQILTAREEGITARSEAKEWERKAVASGTAEVERAQQVRESDRRVESVTREAAAVATELEQLKRSRADEQRAWGEERATWAEERKAWAAERAEAAERLSRLQEELERQKQEQAHTVSMRHHLASSIVALSSDHLERDDSFHFWQARRLPWRRSSSSAGDSPSAPPDKDAAGRQGDAASTAARELASSINIQISRLADELSAVRTTPPSPSSLASPIADSGYARAPEGHAPMMMHPMVPPPAPSMAPLPPWRGPYPPPLELPQMPPGPGYGTHERILAAQAAFISQRQPSWAPRPPAPWEGVSPSSARRHYPPHTSYL